MIIASDGDFPMGESEIWTFIYQPRKLTDLPEDGRDNPGGPGRRDTVIRTTGSGGTGGRLGGFEFKPRQGAITTFLNEKGRDRGVTLIDKDALQLGPRLVDFDEIRDKLKPSVPPALLKELLRSCSGE
jgi:hypothetical protein